MEKLLSEITRKDWIVYQWIETTAMNDPERTFMRGEERTPAEAMQAAEEWDFLQSVKDEAEAESEG